MLPAGLELPLSPGVEDPKQAVPVASAPLAALDRLAGLAVGHDAHLGIPAGGQEEQRGQAEGRLHTTSIAAERGALNPASGPTRVARRGKASPARGEGTHLDQIDGTTEEQSELRRLRRELQESQESHRLLEQVANDALWSWDLDADTIAFSRRWVEMLGEQELGCSSEDWFGRVHEDDLVRLKSSLASLREGASPVFEAVYRIRHREGRWLWVLSRSLPARDPDGVPRKLVGTHTDITSSKRAEEQLARRAFYDPLTDLPNRALFLDRLSHAMRRARRRPSYLFAVLFLDLDHFKVINDSLGHMAGDQLLVLIARRLEATLRPGDTVARLGGDEFTILLDDLHSSEDATRVADRMQNALLSSFDVRGKEIFSTASIGIALSSTGYEQPEDILRDADAAMYRAKGTGRARHALFDTGMHDRAVALLEIEADMRRAVERDELVMHYQPIVSLVSGRITGLEALVRWRHPRRGLIPPGEFVPLAEETGQIIPMGRWVLRRVCRQMGEWKRSSPAMRPLTVNVNLSPRQFSLPDLVGHVDEVLDETGLEASCLRLEITESALMENPDTATRILLQLQLLGVQISLDDFGTGYSSLSYLQRFPIDTLKIDRSFIGGLDREQENLEIARTIVTIGRNLGKEVVAEGIETDRQLELLREIQCEKGQGFLFSRPLMPEDAEELVESGPRW